MRNIKILIEYDGTNYKGWQIQSNAKSVQGELTKALRSLIGSKVTLTGAGRTDSGVHAMGQVANFRTESEISARKFMEGLNGTLPKDIRILHSIEVEEDFHSRRDALERQYHYKVIKRESALARFYAYGPGYDLSLQDMVTAAKIIKANTDFSSFCKTRSETENKKCKIRKSEWRENGDYMYYTIAADRFIYNMVRSLVGTMIEVGRGKITVEQFEEIFDKSDRSAAGPNAPAHGLYLEKVVYAENFN
ncbi:MAG: tRNA pseudouridine(38-40) synthase TruA [Candidatus Marinimicrobia bacterium]|nr:tRNA pseudouridine(38-40) synthase TruA [Candidatus Neomarinimicrobiota bacterium]MCH8304894.1 tRNA pseudouridine(38-40) synthase TruA [Candidatus Neomarinimicrobiota bacterium]